MAGLDDLPCYDYRSDDNGTFVGDPFDGFLEVLCNSYINAGQRAFAAQVQPFQSSETRGSDLANDIEGYMATVGAPYVNIVGHSQDGLDARKAAKVLYLRKERTTVKVLIRNSDNAIPRASIFSRIFDCRCTSSSRRARIPPACCNR